MTQVWQGDKAVAVTRVAVGPCVVLQVKTKDHDGYDAVQLGYGERKIKNIIKPLLGHFKNLGQFSHVREFRTDDLAKGDSAPVVNVGDKIDISTFAAGDEIQAISFSKGKGFQGVVKRHGFHGQDASHGNKDQLRASGSVGAGGVQHVFKGTRMGGRMGGDRVTIKEIEIVGVEPENNVLLLAGPLAGARNSLVMIQASGELKVVSQKSEVVAEEVKTEVEPIEDVKIEEAKAEVETPVEEIKVEAENKIEEAKV